MRWAITGTGLVSSLGHDVGESFDAFCRAESARHPLRVFERSKYRIRAAYEMADRVDGTDTPGRASRWLCESIRQALAQARLIGTARRNSQQRIPVVAGTGLAEQRSLELWWTTGTPLPPDRLHFASAVDRELGLPETLTLVNACSAGLFALAFATDLLALDEADAVVVAAADALTESMVGLLDRVSRRPPAEVRPFDADRMGVLLGEGAAAIVIEPADRAQARGVAPLAYLGGVGTACDAHHVTAPLRTGMGRAFRDAHERAGVEPEQIDLIMAHATGTVLNDETEALALRDVFGPSVERPLITALKSLIGHTSGASGLMSLVTAIAAMEAGRVPPTLNCANPIGAVEGFRLVTGGSRPGVVRTAQVNAFGFGGVNAVAVLERDQRVAASAGLDRPDPDPGRPVAITGVGLAIPGIGSVAELLAGADRRPGSSAFDPRATLGRRGLRYKDRATTLGLCAAAHALADAGLPMPDVDGEPAGSFGVVVSTMFAIARTVCRVVDTIHSDGVEATSPMDLPNVSGNVTASSIAIWFRLAGLNLTVSSGPASGVTAVHVAATAIRSGRARRMLVVGVEPADAVVRRLLGEAAGAGAPPVPFDGAAAVVLESGSAATERGARKLGFVDGYTRHSRLETTVARALADAEPNRPLWLAPCLDHMDAAGVAWSGHVDERVELSRLVGEASGALGVLQCAVAAHWLGSRPGGKAIVSSGGCWGEDFASLALRGAE